MSIDTTGKWWVGSDPSDLREYLVALTSDEESYAVEDFRLAACACGAVSFELHFDRNEGVTRRTCSTCRSRHFICDSGDAAEAARLRKWPCVSCKTNLCNIGVGFALRETAEPRWVYIGVRCASCGILGCCVDWKINYSPSLQLLEQA